MVASVIPNFRLNLVLGQLSQPANVTMSGQTDSVSTGGARRISPFGDLRWVRRQHLLRHDCGLAKSARSFRGACKAREPGIHNPNSLRNIRGSGLGFRGSPPLRSGAGMTHAGVRSQAGQVTRHRLPLGGRHRLHDPRHVRTVGPLAVGKAAHRLDKIFVPLAGEPRRRQAASQVLLMTRLAYGDFGRRRRGGGFGGLRRPTLLREVSSCRPSSPCVRAVAIHIMTSLLRSPLWKSRSCLRR